MGHVHLGVLPQTREWREVVEALRNGGDAPKIASATIAAAEAAFERAELDEGIGWVTYLLARLPLAAEDQDYLSRLGDLGIAVDAPPSVAMLVGAFADAVDDHMLQAGHRTDYGEMAQLAAIETLSSVLDQRATGLWGTSAEDVRRELANFSKKSQFARLAREYFSRLTRRFLTFFLSRELSNHVGGGRRFANLEEHAEFRHALTRHCDEAAQIVEKYSGDWFSKHEWLGDLTPQSARGFSGLALQKLKVQLRTTAVS